MRVIYKDCNKCSHNEVCSKKEDYQLLISTVNSKNNHDLFSNDYSVIVECQHFRDVKKETAFR